MYQSIYYDRTDYTYYLRDDKHGWKENFKYNPTRYQLDPDGELKKYIWSVCFSSSKSKI